MEAGVNGRKFAIQSICPARASALEYRITCKLRSQEHVLSYVKCMASTRYEYVTRSDVEEILQLAHVESERTFDVDHVDRDRTMSITSIVNDHSKSITSIY